MCSPSATLLDDGRGLIAGGASGDENPVLNTSELYGGKIFTLNSTNYCVGDTWILKVTNALASSSIHLIGTSNGAPWEIPAWAKTDANGNFTATGLFVAAAEGTHSLRVHIGGYFSPVLGLDILSC
jgi:hypothetical protein